MSALTVDLPRCLTHGSRREGWVYFLRDDEARAVKIGFSRDPIRRIQQIQTSNPNRLRLLGAIRSVEAFEQFLHWSNRDRRMSGEWFNDTDGGLSSILKMLSTLDE